MTSNKPPSWRAGSAGPGAEHLLYTPTPTSPTSHMREVQWEGLRGKWPSGGQLCAAELEFKFEAGCLALESLLVACLEKKSW